MRNGPIRLRPMPSTHETVALDGAIAAADFPRIAAGYTPRSAAEKWVIRLDGEWLSFYRAATGTCIYQLQIIPEGDDYAAPYARINRDPQQYRNQGVPYDVEMIAYLIDHYLFGRRHLPLPMPPRLSRRHQDAHQEHVMGYREPPSAADGFISLDKIDPAD